MTNVLHTDISLIILPKSFLKNFIDEFVSVSVDSINIDSALLKRSFFCSYLSNFHRQIQQMKDLGNVKQAACLKTLIAYVSIVIEEYLGIPQ